MMRILILTNFYPPHALGGQGQSCQQVAEGLEERGHEVFVLTSMNGTGNKPVEEDGIYRWLYLEMDFGPWVQAITFFVHRKRRERINLERLERVVQAVQPDVAFIWGMWNIPHSVPAYLERRMAGRVVYRFADYWPTLPSQHELYWREEGRTWYSEIVKRAVARIALALLAREERRRPLRFEQAMCVSAATRDILVEAGIEISEATVIHTGLEIERYRDQEARRSRPSGARLRLLYAGRLHADKGLETALRAIARLKNSGMGGKFELSLAGSGDEAYEAYLQRMVKREGLSDCVTFLGQVPAEQMPQLLAQHDVLLVPSEWPEPFSRIVLEGMIAGLVVVAAAVGGTPEAVRHGENGLLFEAGDAADMARKLLSVLEDSALCHQLAESARRTVMEQFTFKKMMDQIETLLQQVAGDGWQGELAREAAQTDAVWPNATVR